MGKSVIVTLVTLFLNFHLVINTSAQQPPETGGVTPRAETIRATPGVNFRRGIEIIEPDSLYGINIRFRVQSRALYFSESLDDLSMQEAEARVRRLRLRLEGFMYNPKLS
jgi:hypothetical protein